MRSLASTCPGTGERSYVSPDIPYAPTQKFSSTPKVTVSLAGMDMTGGLPRLRLGVQHVQAEEFNIRVTTFEDTTFNEVWVTWAAHDGS